MGGSFRAKGMSEARLRNGFADHIDRITFRVDPASVSVIFV